MIIFEIFVNIFQLRTIVYIISTKNYLTYDIWPDRKYQGRVCEFIRWLICLE